MWETEPTGERKIGNMGSSDEKVWYIFVKKNNICFVKYCRNHERIETELSTMKKTHTQKNEVRFKTIMDEWDLQISPITIRWEIKEILDL